VAWRVASPRQSDLTAARRSAPGSPARVRIVADAIGRQRRPGPLPSALVCGRFSQSESTWRLAAMFDAEADDDLPDGGYNVAPTDTIRMVVKQDDQPRLTAARWGLVPFWAGGTKQRAPGWINARAETALDSPAFGPALRQRRCIIPVDAFYEWDRSLTPRQPFAIRAAGDGLLALAGIWSPPSASGLPSAAILTTSPNELLSPIHNRMPVVIPRHALSDWLTADSDIAELWPLLAPCDSSSLRMWPVSSAVNRVGNDGPDLLRRVEIPPTLGLA
jgi:putative SOS response-associated peptidase YedK